MRRLGVTPDPLISWNGAGTLWRSLASTVWGFLVIISHGQMAGKGWITFNVGLIGLWLLKSSATDPPLLDCPIFQELLALTTHSVLFITLEDHDHLRQKKRMHVFRLEENWTKDPRCEEVVRGNWFGNSRNCIDTLRTHMASLWVNVINSLFISNP